MEVNVKILFLDFQILEFEIILRRTVNYQPNKFWKDLTLYRCIWKN